MGKWLEDWVINLGYFELSLAWNGVVHYLYRYFGEWSLPLFGHFA